jgi:3-oxoacyl-[acyl-carrier protein] reductase
MKKAIITAGSRGIGKAISDSLREICDDVIATSSKELDTSDLVQVDNFIKKNTTTDILVMNTGGPPAKLFNDISDDDWNKYHNQLFLSFCLMVQRIHVNDGGYIFLISSFNIKEPDSKLILSNAYRIAMTSVLKSLSKSFATRNVTCINIAPGPIKTDRLFSLVSDMDSLEKSLPMGRAGAPEEIGVFVKSIIENNIKYMTGVTINFDGGASNYVL